MSENYQKNYFAVIDTETNWSNQVMSIGLVIANNETFSIVEKKYYIITPECNEGGMYSSVLSVKGQKEDLKGQRKDVLQAVESTLSLYNVDSIYAYNAKFDFNHLPELNDYKWFDIMKIAAYKQSNKAIPCEAKCCSTGRLKRGYNVQSIFRMLSGSKTYFEIHNALRDAIDELEIMKMLEHSLERYSVACINGPKVYKANKKQPRSTRKQRIIINQVEITDPKELNKEKYTVGKVIKHRVFGRGIIKNVIYEGDIIKKVEIYFCIYGEGTFELPKEDKYIMLI